MTSTKITCQCGHRATPKVDAAGEWYCRGCGFAIDCDECGQTLTGGHDCSETRDRVAA